MQTTPSSFPFVFVPLFVAFWCFISVVLAQAGWRQIASKHPASSAPIGLRFRVTKGWITPYGCHYSNCLYITPASEGIYLAVLFLFRVGHRPMLVPWSCVSSIREHLGWFGGRSLEVALSVDRFVFTLRLPMAAAPVLQDYTPLLSGGDGRFMGKSWNEQ